MGVMVSPDFLFSANGPASSTTSPSPAGCSYFLWSTMPDEELLVLAEQRKLGMPRRCACRSKRMLNDPKARAFTENFVGQWLGLREH